MTRGNSYRGFSRLRVLLVLGCCGTIQLPEPAFAETYYLAPKGSNSSPCAAATAPSTPRRTFAAAWPCLSPGDELIVRDGTYSENITPPPGKSGIAGNPILVKAENDGQVLVQGEGKFTGNAYLTFEGLRMRGRPGQAVISIASRDSRETASHHITLRRMAMECPLTGKETRDGVCVHIGAGAHHNLIEDSWAWGGGRYIVMLYGRDSNGKTTVTGADNNTLRRVVLRMGPHVSSPGNPQAALAIYYGSNNLVENVLALDSETASDSSNAAFYVTAHAPPPAVSGNRFFGILALNTRGGRGFYLDVDKGGVSSRTEIHDSVFWSNEAGGISIYNANAGNNADMIIRQVTSGRNGGDGYQNFTEGVIARSSIFYQNSGFGMSNGRAGNTLALYNLIFGNAKGARNNIPSSPNESSSNPRLLYITRAEENSPCDPRRGDAACGAALTRQYQDGIKTAHNLWPWPNEERIRREMCEVTNRGFCADLTRIDGKGPVTLTSYIWEQLGNPVPPEFYRPAPAN